MNTYELAARIEQRLIQSGRIVKSDRTDISTILDELHEYQMELEAQNTQLLEQANLSFSIQQKYQNLFRYLPVALIAVGGEGQIVNANALAREMLYLDDIGPDNLHTRLLFHFKVDDHARLKQWLLGSTSTSLELIDKYKQKIYRFTDVVMEDDWRIISISEILELSDENPLNPQAMLRVDAMAFMNAMLKHSSDAIFAKDMNGRILNWNSSAEEIYGYSAMEMIGQNVSRLIPHDRINEEDAILERLRRGEAVDSFETTRLHKKGHELRLSINISPVFNPVGQVIAATHIARDISETYQLRQALEGQTELLENMIKFSPVGIARTKNRHFISVNPAICELYGYAEAELINKDARFIYPSSQLYEQVGAAYYDLALAGKTVRLDTLCKRKTGEIIDVRYTWKLIDSAETEPEILLIVEDISAEKQARRSMQQAKDIAERANSMKTRFLSNISHELRTPLHAVSSYAHLIKTRQDKVEFVKDYAEKIHISSLRLTRVIDDLLDISKLESGKLQFEPAQCDLHDIVYAVLNELKVLLNKKHIDLICADDLHYHLTADSHHLRHLLTNLFSNAIKYTPEHGCIEVQSKPVFFSLNSKPVEGLEVSIADSGPGIPDNELSTIFDAFEQSSTTDRGVGGTGLGLAIAKQIVDMHRGQIWAENRAESDQTGAVFKFRIPLQQPECMPHDILLCID